MFLPFVRCGLFVYGSENNYSGSCVGLARYSCVGLRLGYVWAVGARVS